MGKVDSLILSNGKLEIPLVVIKKDNKLLGFVPGLNIKSVWGEIGEEEKILNTLKENTKIAVKKMVKLNIPFPFFPDSTTIRYEFSPIKIEYLKAHISKNK